MYKMTNETDKAILITAPYVIASEAKQSQNDNMKIWIPKSQIYGVKLRKNVFEIYVKESVAG